MCIVISFWFTSLILYSVRTVKIFWILIIPNIILNIQKNVYISHKYIKMVEPQESASKKMLMNQQAFWEQTQKDGEGLPAEMVAVAEN